MISSASSLGRSGARMTISGIVPTNATWAEDIYFTQAGQPMDISGLEWKMTFRASEGQSSADITLSTSDYLSIQTDSDSGVDRILRINVPAGTLSSYSGDYVCDLASQDNTDAVVLWGHGIVTFQLNPVTF